MAESAVNVMASQPTSEHVLSGANGWCELRDANGRLYARLHAREWLLEIKRNDRDAIARFDLRQFLLLAVLETNAATSCVPSVPFGAGSTSVLE